MGMPDALRRWTRDEVAAIPDDGNRYELIEGELLVTPAPRLIHQRAMCALDDRIKPYVARHHLGDVLTAPADLDFARGFSAQPDLFVVPLVGGRKPLHWRECAVPIFIAEIQSPSTGRYDRTIKRPAFQRARVAEYWIVDPDSRIVAVAASRRAAGRRAKPSDLATRRQASPLRARPRRVFRRSLEREPARVQGVSLGVGFPLGCFESNRSRNP